jgi:uncharacterized protein (TIGR03437 family)
VIQILRVLPSFGVIAVLLSWSPALAQTAALSLSSGSGQRGGKALLYLSLDSKGTQPAGLQWTLRYSALDFSSIQVTAGPSAIATGKSVYCDNTPGSYTCLVVGLNSTTISDGVVAALTLSISGATTNTASNIQIDGPLATSAAGNAIPIVAGAASVNIFSSTQSMPNITTAVLPLGITGSAYSQKLAATSGTPPYSWSITSGALPAGLRLASDGTISGTPVATGTSNFVVQLTDQAGVRINTLLALTVISPPKKATIKAVSNAADFQPVISPGSWFSITGSDLASTTRTWNSTDFVNGVMPAQLDGVSVLVDGKPSFVSYIGPTQINAQVPDDSVSGPRLVQVINNGVASDTFTAQLQVYSPALFTWPGNYAVATHTDFTLAAKPSEFPALTTVPAKPGEVIILWGTGCGPTNPAVPAGQLVPDDLVHTLTTVPTVTISAEATEYLGGALAPHSAGLYQLAVRVPADTPDGDWPIVIKIGGVSSPAAVLLTVKK